MIFKFYPIIKRSTIVRADIVRKDSGRFPEGTIVTERVDLYTDARITRYPLG
jgi:hypothetical protein